MTWEQFRDEYEIKQLSHRYAQALDRGDREAWIEVFTPDATLVRSGLPPATYDQIAEIPARQLTRYAKTWHGVQTQNVAVEGDTAHGQVYCIARHVFTDYHNVPGSLPFSLVHDLLIRYQDVYRRDDGVWRFQSRKIDMDLREVRQVSLFMDSVPVGETEPRG